MEGPRRRGSSTWSAEPGPEPGGDLRCVLVRREDRVEDLDDPAVLRDEREPLVEPTAFELERRQAEGVGEPQLGVGRDGVGEVQALGSLPLVVERLCGEADDGGAERSQLFAAVPVPAGLRRAAAGAGRLVPGLRRLDSGPAGARVDVGTSRSAAAAARFSSPCVVSRKSGGTRRPSRWSAAPSSSGTGRPAGRTVGS
jgi:hypothetical protein